MFLWHAAFSRRAAAAAAGNRFVRIHNEPGLVYWTITAWDSLDSMMAFRNSGPHLKAMSKLARWCDEGAYCHWASESPVPPTLAEARERLRQEGRFSKVEFPSDDHANRRIPPSDG